MWTHQNYYAMHGLYGAAAAASAFAAHSGIVGNPFAVHPASMIDRPFAVTQAGGQINPFAPRSSPTSPLSPQHLAVLRGHFSGLEGPRFDTQASDFQKQIQQTMSLPRLLPTLPNYQSQLHSNLPPISYYMPNNIESSPTKSTDSPHRPVSRSPSYSGQSQETSPPPTSSSPPEKSPSPSILRKFTNKSPQDKQPPDGTSAPSISTAPHPFALGSSLRATSPGFLPSLVASGSFFRPYLTPNGPHGLMRTFNHLSGSPIMGPLNTTPARVPVSPTCLRK